MTTREGKTVRDNLELSYHSTVAANKITKNCNWLLGFSQVNCVLVYLATLLAQNGDAIV
jgi:hypothetical protein